jgi:hypothetical protein
VGSCKFRHHSVREEGREEFYRKVEEVKEVKEVGKKGGKEAALYTHYSTS